jgi:hypothetical protein
MKRVLGIVAVTASLAAAPAFAGVDVFVNFGTPAAMPAPVYVAPARVYAAPVVYEHRGPGYYERHDRFDHRYGRDYRDRRWERDYRGRW